MKLVLACPRETSRLTITKEEARFGSQYLCADKAQFLYVVAKC